MERAVTRQKGRRGEGIREIRRGSRLQGTQGMKEVKGWRREIRAMAREKSRGIRRVNR